MCARVVLVPNGILAAVFKVGHEPLGICCDDCLSDEACAHLAERRRVTLASSPRERPATEAAITASWRRRGQSC